MDEMMSKQGKRPRSVNTKDKICFWCGQSGHVRASCPELIQEGCGDGHNRYNRGRGHGFGMCDGVAKSWQRNGDWLCPNANCGNVNFAFCRICNLCGVTRPAGDSGTTQLVSVRMTAEDMVKWQWFKKMSSSENSSKEAPVSAVSAGPWTNASKAVSCDRPWLIDSGASRHMVGSYEDFLKYVPNVMGQDVKLADGSTQAIMGSGTVICGPNMSLSSVLHVPSFPINLLSISCITKELNCAAVFFPTWCLFLQLGTWKILGTGIMRDGLYYLDDDMTPMAAAVLSRSPLEEFLLHHRRLGHMSFNTLGVDCETGGDKEKEDDDAASRKMIIGVIPAGAEQEQKQGEQYDTSNKALRWPRPNEEREIQVYTRRRHTEKEQMQVLELESETHGQHQEQEVDQQDDTQGQTNDTGPSSDNGPLPRD